MIEIRELRPRAWEPSEPLVAYNKADRRVVIASEMSRGNDSYYDRYGYQGSRDIVCIDCLEAGRDVPVSLVEAARKCIHFRHKAGEAPDGLGRHGETAEHLHGKQLVMDWVRDQPPILPKSVEEEVWVHGARLRSDVKAEVIGNQLAFEVQRKPMDATEWNRRHGGYQHGGVLDVWLWSPDVPHLVLDLPMVSVVLDLEHAEIGVLVARYAGRYSHPTARERILIPTHYAAAPLTEWGISTSGSLRPPAGMRQYIGSKPDAARISQLRAHRERASPSLQQPGRPLQTTPRQAWSASRSTGGRGTGGRAPYLDPEREAQRQREAIEQIMRRKR